MRILSNYVGTPKLEGRMSRRNKGQIAIFVIIAVVLVAIIALFFFALREKEPTLTRGQDFNPESFIDICIRGAVRENADAILERGGLTNPVNYAIYDDLHVNYICYNQNNYFPCITQYPSFISHVREEIETSSEGDIDSCFASLENEMNQRGYDYNSGEHLFNVILQPDSIKVVVQKDISFSKGGEDRQITEFTTLIPHPAYDLSYVANEIARQEAQRCHFSYDGFTILYPDFEIRKFTLSDGTDIYKIKHTKTEKLINIAIRGCVIPQGF